MNKKIVVGVIGLSFFVVSGCDKLDDTSLVKDGTLEMDKSLTVGQAMNNYKYFKKTTWNLVKTDNGRKFVEVTGDVDTAKHPSLNSQGGVKNIHIKFQFKINQDKTFEVAWCGVEGVRSDDSVIEESPTINIAKCMNSLKAIYANDAEI